MKNETFIIVLPVFNEEECIEIVVMSWIEILKKFPGSEMLILNDGSTDNTLEKLNKLKSEFKEVKLINKINEGHGTTIRKGYIEAIKTKHDWVFQTDSDNQFNHIDFYKLWDKRKKSNFILGYRAKRKDTFNRLIVTKTIVLVIYLLFGIFIKDANIPFRLIEKNYLKKLINACPSNIFNINICLSILAKKDKQDLLNIPVLHKDRRTGKVANVGLKFIKVCIVGLKQLINFRFNLSQILQKTKEA